MNNIRTWVWRIVAGVLLVGIARPAEAQAVERLLADLKKRHAQAQNVRYTLTGVREVKRSQDKPAGPERSKPQAIRAMLTIDLANKKYRLESNEQIFSEADGKVIRRVGTHAYDGKAEQHFLPRDQNAMAPNDPDLILATGPLGGGEVDARYHPVFAAHGVLPTVNKALMPDQLPVDHDPDEFVPRGEVAYAGRRCTVFRTEPLNTVPGLTDELWTDPARDSAVLRKVLYSGKSPTCRLDVEFQGTPHGWLPKSWTVTWAFGGKVDKIERLTVTNIEFDLPLHADDFTLPVRPGMIILADQYPSPGTGLNPAYPAHAKYQVDESGRWVELEKKGFTTFGGQVTDEGVQLPSGSTRRWWWIAGGSVLVIGLGALIVWRYRARRST
ncbi:MAG TPA: hypothetical protein VFG68_00315 [Fimbriiglobus sp.]|nr:hypothetical protein [Fimbriiglobus sp.]